MTNTYTIAKHINLFSDATGAATDPICLREGDRIEVTGWAPNGFRRCIVKVGEKTYSALADVVLHGIGADNYLRQLGVRQSWGREPV